MFKGPPRLVEYRLYHQSTGIATVASGLLVLAFALSFDLTDLSTLPVAFGIAAAYGGLSYRALRKSNCERLAKATTLSGPVVEVARSRQATWRLLAGDVAPALLVYVILAIAAIEVLDDHGSAFAMLSGFTLGGGSAAIALAHRIGRWETRRGVRSFVTYRRSLFLGRFDDGVTTDGPPVLPYGFLPPVRSK